MLWHIFNNNQWRIAPPSRPMPQSTKNNPHPARDDGSQPPLRVGLLVNESVVPKYDADFVRWASTRQDIDVSHLIIHAPREIGADGAEQNSKAASPRKSLLSRISALVARQGIVATVSGMLWQYLEWSEKRLLARNDELLRGHFDTVDIHDQVAHQLTINPIVSKSGFVYRFSEEDIDAVKSLDLDLMIRCGDGILRGEILNSAKFGVLSFHHADNRVNRGGPPAFWEVFYKEPKTSFTIQKLSDVLDGGDVYQRGHFPTQYPYLVNEAQLFAKANPFMRHVVDHIARHRQLPDALPQLPYSGRLFKRPNVKQMLRYLGERFFRRNRQRAIYAAGYRDLWHVAYCHSDWTNAELWRGPKLVNPPGTFLADPFVIQRDNKSYCFVEELDLAIDKAVISVYELGKNEAIPLGTVLEEPFHLSFPYLFEYQDTLYMCPETSTANDIRVYRCDQFPMQWTLEKVIKPNFYAADTMLFEHGDRWWMFTNTDEAGIDEFCSELNIFWSDSPLSTDWTPHRQNPVIVDSQRARNGGLLSDSGELYRVGQEQGFATYGAACRIHRIKTLTPELYEEEEIARVSPEFDDGAHGGHHLHSNGTTTVFDYRALVRP